MNSSISNNSVYHMNSLIVKKPFYFKPFSLVNSSNSNKSV